MFLVQVQNLIDTPWTFTQKFEDTKKVTKYLSLLLDFDLNKT